jgi:hypothetical protein
MEHFYQNINSENWFDFENIYKYAVEKFGCGSHFVEVGSWKGMSSCYMSVEIINSGKNIKFDCVDTWKGSEEHLNPQSSYFNGNLLSDDDWLYNLFLKNVNPVINTINLVRGISWEMSKLYDDKSLDFIFIDAAHDYDSVTKDILSWVPKLKEGGLIGGHDYSHPPVKKAVDEFFNESNVTINGGSWLIM